MPACAPSLVSLLTLARWFSTRVTTALDPTTTMCIPLPCAALPFLYPESPRGEIVHASLQPRQLLPRIPSPLSPSLLFLHRPPFPSAHTPSMLIPFGPVGLLIPSTMSRLNRFLLYKHWGTTIRQHSSSSHAESGRHSCTPLRRFYYFLNMPGPIRRTPSNKASDFLKPEYRRSPTPEMDPDQPSTSSATRGSRSGRTSARRL